MATIVFPNLANAISSVVASGTAMLPKTYRPTNDSPMKAASEQFLFTILGTNIKVNMPPPFPMMVRDEDVYGIIARGAWNYKSSATEHAFRSVKHIACNWVGRQVAGMIYPVAPVLEYKQQENIDRGYEGTGKYIDFQGQGVANDYVRSVGDNPRFIAVALAGKTNDQYTKTNENTFGYK
jgi:hypothetical protein